MRQVPFEGRQSAAFNVSVVIRSHFGWHDAFRLRVKHQALLFWRDVATSSREVWNCPADISILLDHLRAFHLVAVGDDFFELLKSDPLASVHFAQVLRVRLGPTSYSIFVNVVDALVLDDSITGVVDHAFALGRLGSHDCNVCPLGWMPVRKIVLLLRAFVSVSRSRRVLSRFGSSLRSAGVFVSHKQAAITLSLSAGVVRLP
jgi:hypothetical protein